MAQELVYPRNVHKPAAADGSAVCKVVQNEDELAAAVAEGWAVDPVLTDEQKAAVQRAKVAAGEAKEPKAEPKK